MKMSMRQAERLFRRGMSLHKQGRIVQALHLYQAIVREHPGYAPALHHAALATQHVRKHARSKGLPCDEQAELRLVVAAVEYASRVAQKAEAQNREAFWGSDNPIAHARLAFAAMIHNYAKFQQDRGVLEGADGARALFVAALEFNPTMAEGWTNLGNVYAQMGDRDRSDQAFDIALRHPTAEPETEFNLSFLRIMRGDYERGWRDYEARWSVPEFLISYGRDDLTAPRWDGAKLEGTLYLHGEQGAGDVIMMARYIPLVQARVGTLIVEVLEPLVTYFRATFPGVAIVARGDDPPPHDAHLPMLSLPATFGTSLNHGPCFGCERCYSGTVPPPIPTKHDGIVPDPTKIGVCWKGSATHVNDRNRSMPVEAIAPLLALEGFRWQSLQFGADDVAGLAPLISTDYLDTAKEIASCGLVISVDTSVAHLAATLGVETWLLLPYHAEFRWMQDREDTPWYPRARLWRQHRPGDWTAIVLQLKAALLKREMQPKLLAMVNADA